MGEYHEEVLINLLDLQAELRDDGSEESAEAGPAVQEEALAVTDGGLTVSVPDPADETAAHDRIAALNGRLGKLESVLAGVTERIERIDPFPQMRATGSPDTDDDAGSGSFLDLQKIVADRLDRR
ncbi:MAG TPA: hypothetical protein VF108_07270 [Actinomycetota bacterium]